MRQITVSLDPELVELIDEVAKARRRSRSSLVALIIEKWSLELEDQWPGVSPGNTSGS